MSESDNDRKSFLALLLEKKSSVLKVQAESYIKAYKNMSRGARSVADWIGSVEGKED